MNQREPESPRDLRISQDYAALNVWIEGTEDLTRVRVQAPQPEPGVPGQAVGPDGGASLVCSGDLEGRGVEQVAGVNVWIEGEEDLTRVHRQDPVPEPTIQEDRLRSVLSALEDKRCAAEHLLREVCRLVQEGREIAEHFQCLWDRQSTWEARIRREDERRT